MLSTRVCVLLSILVCLTSATCAAPTTPDDASLAVSGWLASDDCPLGARLGTRVSSAESISDTGGGTAFYVVYLDPAGFVIVSPDDSIEPIIAFASEGTFDESPGNPLPVLTRLDLKQRLADAKASDQQASAAAASSPAREKWRQLMGRIRALRLTSISDPRVSPLVQSRWDQKTEEDSGLALYNYYTPPGPDGSANNHYCGCVATALAQIMRYHSYPTTGVGTPLFSIKVCGSPTTRRLRGGDGRGGPYNWSSMVLVPNYAVTQAQRQAIGALCHDAGVAVGMDYCSNGSGAYVSGLSQTLKSTFRYGNAVGYVGYGVDTDLMINTNLDAGLPVFLAILESGESVGHAIVCDGYGYNWSTEYHHLNLGWSGSSDAWYNLPLVDSGYYTFDTLYGCVYNIYPTGGGEIISGRVTDESGNPIDGVTVTATSGSSSHSATTNSRGIYALKGVPANTLYLVTAAKPGLSFTSRSISTRASADSSSACGNVWGVDLSTGAAPPPTGLTVTSLAINSGASSTIGRGVTLNNVCSGSPTHYIASESASFVGASWQSYSQSPGFTLSSGAGTKTIYFKVKDAGGESPVVSDTIELQEPVNLIVDGPELTGSISPAGDADWFVFTVAAADTYTVDTRAGSLDDNYMYLYGPDSDSTLVATDDDSGVDLSARLVVSLSPGVYYVKIRAYSASDVGTYSISVKSTSGIAVTSFSINYGDSRTSSRTVTLSNSCLGSPGQYMASESASFSGASWQSYSSSPSFTLSSGDGTKTVYFKVKNSSGVESPVVSDSIELVQVGSSDLVVDGPHVTSAISEPYEEDWYQFTVTATDTYVIETRLLSLYDNCMELYGPGVPTNFIARDDDSGIGLAARLELILTPGTYFALVYGYDTSCLGDYTIGVSRTSSMSVSYFEINDGDETTMSRTVSLYSECSGVPAFMMASESPSFDGAAWQAYSPSSTFTLSPGDGPKTVYYKVKNAGGVESAAVTDTIELDEPQTLIINAPDTGGEIESVGVSDWYQFTVTAGGTYTIETSLGTLSDTVIQLYGPSSALTLIDADDDSGDGTASRLTLPLSIGTYYVKVTGYSPDLTGTYTVGVRRGAGPAVASFSLNDSDAVTYRRAIVLTNICVGNPAQYMASESSSFTNAVWKTYSAAPAFTLSQALGQKRVYFKVKNAQGVSAVVNDTITLADPPAQQITINGPAVNGEIAESGGEEWFQFTVTTAAIYTIDTEAASLNDTVMQLYGPNKRTTLVETDDDDGDGYMARITRRLTAGTYYVKVRSFALEYTGTYSISVQTGPGIAVQGFAINSGAETVTGATVTLTNTCDGNPTSYMASGYASFSGAGWKSYSTAPTFTLSYGKGVKTVYFKVRNAAGGVSPVVHDTIVRQ